MFARFAPVPNVQNKFAILAQPLSALRLVKRLDPQLGSLIAQFKPQAGAPRSQMTVPIAPSDALADTMIWEASANRGRRFYLPRYSVANRQTDQGTQTRLRLTRQDPATRISVVVQPSMAPEANAGATDATPLTHEVTGLLTFELPSDGMKREWVFTDRGDEHPSHEVGADDDEYLEPSWRPPARRSMSDCRARSSCRIAVLDRGEATDGCVRGMGAMRWRP
jgi:hypothetical protein